MSREYSAIGAPSIPVHVGKEWVVRKENFFIPSEEMKKVAWLKDEKMYEEASKNPVSFWAKLAEEGIDWYKKWEETYVERLPYLNGLLEEN